MKVKGVGVLGRGAWRDLNPQNTQQFTFKTVGGSTIELQALFLFWF